MRIALAEFKQETNTFVPFTTTLQTFEEQYLHRGAEMLTAFGQARLEIPGALDAIREAGAEPVPLLATMAMASGTVERKSFDILMGEIEDRLKAAGPVDGIFLSLHGAMIVEDEPDAESEIVRRVHACLEPGTPITVSLDLHGHITAAMLQPDVAYIGYREFPHIDMYETGYRCAKLLIDWVNGKVKPVMALSKRHMVFSPDSARTTAPPLADIVAEGRAMEARGEVLHVSLFPVQPWIDTPDLGFAALVCGESEEAAQAAADKLAKMAWDRRAEFEPDVTPLEETIRIGLTSPGLTVVSDSGDTPSGGAAADSTAVLAALLHAGADRSARISICTICDAQAAAEAARAGAGKTVTLKIGHKRDGPDRGAGDRQHPTQPALHPPFRMGSGHPSLGGARSGRRGAGVCALTGAFSRLLYAHRGAYFPGRHAGSDLREYAAHPLHQGDAALLPVGSGERLTAPACRRQRPLCGVLLAEILQHLADTGFGNLDDRFVHRHPG
jgi:microcystin degradation protein MlrC